MVIDYYVEVIVITQPHMKGVGIIHWNIAWLKKEFAVFPSKCFPVPGKLIKLGKLKHHYAAN